MWYHEYKRNVEIVIHVKHAREENEGKCRTTKENRETAGERLGTESKLGIDVLNFSAYRDHHVRPITKAEH